MKSASPVLAVLLFSLASSLALHAQTPHTLYIDASSNNGPANWNNLALNTLGASLLLKDSQTNATGIRATVAVRLNGANTNGSTTPSEDAAEFAPAGGNSSYGHSTVWSGVDPILYGEVVFSNLNPTVAYDFTFYGSRMSTTDNRETRYTVTGSNSGTALLNVTTNSTRVASVPGMYPSAAGALVVRIEKGPANNNSYGFYHITAMKIAYTDPPPTVLYVDAAGAATAAGWNLLRMNDNSDVVLADTNGVPSGIRAQVTAPLASVNTLSEPAPVGDAAEFGPAGTDTGYDVSANTGYIKLYNLKPALSYSFTFYASRINSASNDTRQTLFTVTGASVASNNLEAANNTQEVAVIAGLLPAADGTVTVRISRGYTNSTGFIYFTAFKVTYADNGVSVPAAPIAGKRLLFFGNQYTGTENVPNLVAILAEIGGHPRPFVFSDLANERALSNQIARVNGYPGFNVDCPLLTGTNTWDHVVIQGHGDESSSLGDAAAFRTNALALYQKVKNHATGKGAGAGAVLFQTWARGTGSAVYPAAFADPAAMQAEIDANTALATNSIAAAEGASSVLLAPVGDAFATGGHAPATLYNADLNNPGNAGSELAALVLYKTLYGGAVTGITYDAAINAGLTTMTERDWIRVTHWAEGLAAPEPAAPAASDRRVILLDACVNAAGSPAYLGWNYRSFHTLGSVQLVLTNGYPTAATCEVLTRMNATTSSSAANPTGDAAIFARALANNAYGNINPFGTYSNAFCEARFSGLGTLSAYTFTFYASRTGSTGRETLFLLDGANSGSAALEAGGNSTQVAVVQKIRPRPDGTIGLKITAGPNNTSAEKFYHINALMIESARGGLLITVQ